MECVKGVKHIFVPEKYTRAAVSEMVACSKQEGLESDTWSEAIYRDLLLFNINFLMMEVTGREIEVKT